jgi:hypothetical protein
MVDTRRSSRDTGVNASTAVLKIGKAAGWSNDCNPQPVPVLTSVAAAIATREKRVTDPSPNDQQAETKDWILHEHSWGVRANNEFHLIDRPMKPSYNNHNIKPVTSNTAKDGANLHYRPAVPIKRAAPVPMMQNNKRASNDSENGQAEDLGKAERSATYTRLVKERKEVVRSKDTLREKSGRAREGC